MDATRLQHDAVTSTTYVQRYVNHYWHVNAIVTYENETRQQAEQRGEWPIVIVPAIPPKVRCHRNCGGIHLSDHGRPYALVLWQGRDWTEIVLSHELAEMLVDPLGVRGFHGWQLEVADPVQLYSKRIDGIWTSDIVTPHYFGITHHGPFDIFGHVHKQLHPLPGGYNSRLR